MKLAILTSFIASVAAIARALTGCVTIFVSKTKAEMEALAKKLNPVLSFYNPLNLAEAEFRGQSNEATIGFLCHSEILKHRRIAVSSLYVSDSFLYMVDVCLCRIYCPRQRNKYSMGHANANGWITFS